MADDGAALIAALRAEANRFGPPHASRKAALLREAAALPLTDPDTLLAYHDVLLFLLAYPESAALLATARRELARVADAARALLGHGPARARARLANSGVAWAPMTIAFGHDIARWLAEQHPGTADVDSFDEGGAPLPAVLRHALPAVEFELLEHDADDAMEFLAAAGAGHSGTKLEWLVAQFARLPCPDALREHLFDSLKAYVTIRPGDGPLSRTFLRGPSGRTFFHRGGLLRRVDVEATVATPLPPPRRLAAAERARLLDAGRAMLASLGRETDALSAADAAGVEYYALPRGVAIALYTMAPGRRLPLDSHVGFMLFKNSLPIGYGGGWPFLGTCRIGVNIFAPYRGGESAFLFCQVLRVYARRFGVARFIAEPSQYGGGNREGLESGAFWFYYRLGFRPVAPRLAALAAAEFARMQATPGCRPPLAVLRRFTRSDIALDLARAGDPPPAVDAADLSLAVSAWIAARFGGDRTRATAFATRKVARALGVRDASAWPAPERAAFESFCLLLARIPGLADWPARDKARLVALARAKGGDEFRYFDLMRGHARLHRALARLAAAER